MASAPKTGKRLFVIDTNVLLHDPTALFRFKEHDLYLPMMVLEELDAAKKGVSEVARNARQVSRFLDDLIGKLNQTRGTIHKGLKEVARRIMRELLELSSKDDLMYFA